MCRMMKNYCSHFFYINCRKKMSPTKLKARPIDNKNKMPHSFKLRMKILTTKPTEICYLMYPVPIIFIS